MRKIINLFTSPVLMLFCLVAFAVSMAVATFVEAIHGTPVARELVFDAKWFELIMLIGVINLVTTIFVRKLYRKEKLTIFIFHIAFSVIIIGAGVTRYIGFEGTMQIMENEHSNQITLPDNSSHELPFSIFLKDFIVDYYPGSKNPSGFESSVVLIDQEREIWESRRIFMNNILKHRGYRFYQASYTKDEKGTILSVSKDALGTTITYAGYFLLFLGMILSLVNKNSRFRHLAGNKSVLAIFLLFSLSLTARSQQNDSLPVIPQAHAEKFGEVLVRDYQGRTKPMNTLLSDIQRKVNRSDDFNGQSPVQVFLGMLVFPEKWQSVKFIYGGTDVADFLDLDDKRSSLLESYLGEGRFISSSAAYHAYQKAAGERSKTENSLIKYDERLNILYHWFMGNMLNVFPVPNDTSGKWYNPVSIKGKVSTEDSVFVYNVLSLYLIEVKNAVNTGNWSTPDELLFAIKQYQSKYGSDIPSERKIKLEQRYYRSGIFKRSAYLYLLLGLLLLITRLIVIFREKPQDNLFSKIIAGGIVGVLLLHSWGLGVRWYISGHAPWSNAYETMIFIAWSGVLAGSFFIRKNPVATSISALMASIFLIVANMSWMDPQITNLVPVLKSVWLVIHVAVITSSYGFLGIGCLMAFVNLIVMGLQNKKNYPHSEELIGNLTRIIEKTLTIGLYLVTIGTFLGGIWANVSWGRYWGWDPKETWALITIIVYAIVLHLRFIPGLKSVFVFNMSTLIAYSSVLMTYFGVNFYLSGLHSYAKGDPAPIPNGVYYTVAIVLTVILLAYLNRKRIEKLLAA